MKRGYKNLPVGESHHAAKLGEANVVALRDLNKRGVCLRCAVKVLGLQISYPSAWDAANYKTWRHVHDQ